MSDQWEKYVDQAAVPLDPIAFDQSDPQHEHWAMDLRRGIARDRVREALAVVGPLIAEDTRERMVAAAARAVEREKADRPKWTDLFGIDPDYTGEACSVDYVRWQRGADTSAEFEHEKCAAFLLKEREAQP